MSKYIKKLDESQQRYHIGLKKGVDIYKGVPPHENIKSMDKYVFKFGDLNSEIRPDEFPFTLKSDCCLTVLNVKGYSMNYIIEVESEKCYFIKFYTPQFGFNLIAAWNEKEKDFKISANIPTKLVLDLKAKGIRKEKLVDQIRDDLSKMIALLSNEDSLLRHKTVAEYKTGISRRSVGFPTLVSTRYFNHLHICDAYPYFYMIDFKAMNKDFSNE